MELTYTQVGDFQIPNLVLDSQPSGSIGKYGRMRKRYLEAKQKLTGVNVEALRAERSEVYEKVASINAELRECRKELRLCEQIQADSPKIQQAMSEEVELEEDYEMEERNYEPEETL